MFAELSPRLPNDAMLACDTGTTVHWYSRNLKIRTGMRAAHSGTLASMGAAIPYAVAAKFAHPELPALCFVGDGAMQMNGINELITVARYWKRWRDPRFVVLVMNNRDLNMVTWEQRILAGDRKFEASQELPDFPYAAYAQSIGLGGSASTIRTASWSRSRMRWRPTVHTCSRSSAIQTFHRCRRTYRPSRFETTWWPLRRVIAMPCEWYRASIKQIFA